MALLIHKLFASRKKQHHKHQDVSERAFTFDKDQVRVILFRECDFRGRKLLFDSQSVQKVAVSSQVKNPMGNSGQMQTEKNENFVEIANGFGYQYTRPSSDIIQLGELVFGSVAMSFRGTSLKIHSFLSPAKLMCTQVFPSPRHPSRGRSSLTTYNYDTLRSNSSVHSFEISLKLDYSRTNSTASFNEQVSMHSTESDVKVTMSGSVPLNVPTYNQSMTNSKLAAPSLEGDSGFCGEQSYSSVSSGPPSMSLWDTRQDRNSVCGFSCGSLYKRWLRSTSTSLDQNGYSDGSFSGAHSSASADECMTRGHHRTSKLGLAVIVMLTEGQENDLERFLLEHSALIEAMVHRARSGAEAAYTKPSNFASLMYDIAKETSQWITDLITGPTISAYHWHTLGLRPKAPLYNSTNCDNLMSTLIRQSVMTKTLSDSNLVKLNMWCDRTKNSSLLNIGSVKGDNSRHFSNGSVLKCDESEGSRCMRIVTSDASLNAEKFVRELCELLESIDVKHTNFFISTLLTAILTHHLGWVSTILQPSETDEETISKLYSPCNPLWGQLCDLYGAVGSPTKVAHTIICGNNKGDIIAKIINTLTYFIRCSAVERHLLSQYTVDETPKVDCSKGTPLKVRNERLEPLKDEGESLEMSTLRFEERKPVNGLTRTKSFLRGMSDNRNGSLLEQATDNENGPKVDSLLERVTNLGLSAEKNSDRLQSNLKVLQKESNSSMDVQKSSVFKPSNLKKDISCSNLSKLVGNHVPSIDEPDCDKNVIFVLGDNEKLVGLKKPETSFDANLNIPSCSGQRPTNLQLQLTNRKLFQCSSSSDSSPQTDVSPCSNKFTDNFSSNVSQNKIIISRSSVINMEAEYDTELELRRRDKFNRSQSVPPPDKKDCLKSSCKKKYSGVKFDFKQYPQIVTNYMKSKNLEMSQLAFAEKSFKLNRSFSTSVYDCSNLEFPSCDCEPQNEETLQTPSNASELEFSSELANEKYEKRVKALGKTFLPVDEVSESCSKEQDVAEFQHPLQENASKENNAIFEHDIDTYELKPEIEQSEKIIFTELLMPRIIVQPSSNENSFIGYTKTLLRGVSDRYVSDMVLQGTTALPKQWEHILRRDLSLSARKPLLDQPVQEAVAIVANTDTWEVQLISSHTYVVERGSVGIRVGMSQLVSNMLESLLHMWKLRTPPEYCLMHIESRLREFCIRSKSLAQLLMTTDFCNMDLLTSSLQLEVNDVPLLMAVASTHTPQVTQKYGLSFQ